MRPAPSTLHQYDLGGGRVLDRGTTAVPYLAALAEAGMHHAACGAARALLGRLQPAPQHAPSPGPGGAAGGGPGGTGGRAVPTAHDGPAGGGGGAAGGAADAAAQPLGGGQTGAEPPPPVVRHDVRFARGGWGPGPAALQPPAGPRQPGPAAAGDAAAAAAGEGAGAGSGPAGAEGGAAGKDGTAVYATLCLVCTPGALALTRGGAPAAVLRIPYS
jgi:hypothetical protein